MNDTETLLRMEIKKQLKKVTAANSPHIWKMIQDAKSYRKLEEQIIEKVIHLQITPGAIIPQMEQEMSMQ